MKMNQKGFVTPLLSVVVIGILLIGGGSYIYTQKNNVNNYIPSINSIATTTDHGMLKVLISGSNFTNMSVVEYLNNGKFVDSFCGYLINNGTEILTHSWVTPEGGLSHYSNINGIKVINTDCRTFDIKSSSSSYPTSAILNIGMVDNQPVVVKK